MTDNKDHGSDLPFGVNFAASLCHESTTLGAEYGIPSILALRRTPQLLVPLLKLQQLRTTRCFKVARQGQFRQCRITCSDDTLQLSSCARQALDEVLALLTQ